MACSHHCHNWIVRHAAIVTSGMYLVSSCLLNPQPLQAQSLELRCSVLSSNEAIINNIAEAQYVVPTVTRSVSMKTLSNLAQTLWQNDSSSVQLQISPQGVTNGSNGDRLISVGVLIDAFTKAFDDAGLSASEAGISGVLAARTLLGQQRDVPIALMATIIKQGVILEYPAQTATIQAIPDQEILQILTATTVDQLRGFGASTNTATNTAAIARQTINEQYSSNPDLPFNEFTTLVHASVLANISDTAEKTEVQEALTGLLNEIERLRQANDPTVNADTVLVFSYLFTNPSDSTTLIQVPSLSTFAANAVSGSGTLQGVDFKVTDANGVETTATVGNSLQVARIPPQGTLEIHFRVLLGSFDIEGDTSVKVNLSTSCGDGDLSQSFTLLPPLNYPLVDPLGRLTGCAGELLPDYRGFSVALYDVKPGTTEISNLTPLTITEIPDDPSNNISKGLPPNADNSNPFFLTNSDQGRYNFLFDPSLGQLDFGRQFILVVTPPSGSGYTGRRVLVTIGIRTGSTVSYVAQSIDGNPIISATDGRTSVNGTIEVGDATTVGLSLAVLQVVTSVCQQTEIEINKTGDRSVVEPGDTILYRLSIRNLANSDLKTIEIEDTLPRGINFIEGSVRAEVESQPRTVTTTVSGRNVTFAIPGTLGSGGVINLIYAAQVTPDALRGEGKNYALVEGARVSDDRAVSDGPAIHAVRVDPGIIRSCGTLIGRVFVDKNFDGQQQEGEPGVPNAVIYLEDGNRIITDAEGLYSVANILPGYHTGVLDLNSLPGYTLAPNLKFIEENSQSRSVNLPPGGMERMNFGVTPTFNEEGK